MGEKDNMVGIMKQNHTEHACFSQSANLGATCHSPGKLTINLGKLDSGKTMAVYLY